MSRQHWGQVPEDGLTEPFDRGPVPRSGRWMDASLTGKRVDLVRRLHTDGESAIAISRLLGVDDRTVRRAPASLPQPRTRAKQRGATKGQRLRVSPWIGEQLSLAVLLRSANPQPHTEPDEGYKCGHSPGADDEPAEGQADSASACRCLAGKHVHRDRRPG